MCWKCVTTNQDMEDTAVWRNPCNHVVFADCYFQKITLPTFRTTTGLSLTTSVSNITILPIFEQNLLIINKTKLPYFDAVGQKGIYCNLQKFLLQWSNPNTFSELGLTWGKERKYMPVTTYKQDFQEHDAMKIRCCWDLKQILIFWVI